jgi:arabinogalactan oligomer/maltooligosaccharide transport system permease protein
MAPFRWLAGTQALGLTIAVGATLALSAWLFAGAERDQQQQFERRLVQVEANALAAALTAARMEGVAERLRAWQASHGAQESAIVVSGMELLGSTRAEDAAPRRLVREEKPLFDLAQQIRADRETNISEGAVRKKLVQFDEGQADSYVATVPLVSGDEFAGILQIRVQRAYGSGPATTGRDLLWLPILLAAALAGAFIRSRGDRPSYVAYLLALAAFLGLTLLYQGQRMDAYVAADLTGTQQVAGAVRQAVGWYGLPGSGAEAASPWDTDSYLRPLAVVGGGGARAEPARLEHFTQRLQFFQRSLWAVEGLGLLVLLAFVSGHARRLAQTLRSHANAYAYIAPAMIGMLVLVFFPFIFAIVLSFTDTTLFNESLPFTERWLGWDNYLAILGDFNLYQRGPDGLIWNYQNFYWTLMVTVVWTISNVTVGVTVGFMLAMLLNTEGLRGKALYRVILILPWAIPNYITALVWRGMFHPQFGVINQILQMFGLAPVAWFDGVASSFLTGLATNGWLSFPFMMVVILGALQSIPKDMYEAAEVEGASRWQRLRHITLPLLRPTLVPAIVISVVWTFNMFNIIFLVSGGEPAGANEILVTKAYKIAFENYQYAYAAAYSTVIFAILLVYGYFQTRMTRATESY